MKLLGTLAIAAMLVSLPATAKDARLAHRVQHLMDSYGIHGVDADRLSKRQVAAIYLKFQDAPPRFGRGSLQFKQQIRTILRWREK